MNYTLQQSVELGTLVILIGREARNQSPQAMLGVAYSVRNRVFKPRYWGTDWLSVMTHLDAYSSMTIPGDKNLVVWPNLGQTAWQEVMQAAEAAYNNTGQNPISDGTHYFSIDINPPAWATAPDTEFIIQLGAFKFYRAY